MEPILAGGESWNRRTPEGGEGSLATTHATASPSLTACIFNAGGQHAEFRRTCLSADRRDDNRVWCALADRNLIAQSQVVSVSADQERTRAINVWYCYRTGQRKKAAGTYGGVHGVCLNGYGLLEGLKNNDGVGAFGNEHTIASLELQSSLWVYWHGIYLRRTRVVDMSQKSSAIRPAPCTPSWQAGCEVTTRDYAQTHCQE